MAKKTISQEVVYRLTVTQSELELLRTALCLVRDFGLVEDWDKAQDLLSDFSEEH